MKAAVCYEFGQQLVIEEVAIDPPKVGEVKVKLAACAICHSDIHYAEGAWGGTLPAIYGHEAAGVVTEVGPGVKLIQPGAHVVVTLMRSCGRCYYCAIGDPHLCETELAIDREQRIRNEKGQPVLQGLRAGAFAEYVVVDESQLVSLPADMPLDSAALLGCAVITGLGAVMNTARVSAGSSVVVIGIGGVGLNCVQGARLVGAQPVIAVDLAEKKLEAANMFGATHTINAATNDVREVVRELTAQCGAGYVFVAVGNVTAMEQGLKLLRKGGTLVIVGMPASGIKMQFEPVILADRGQRILGSKMGSGRLRVDVPKLGELYQEGRLKLDELISARYPLKEINAAIAAVNRGEALRNVIVF